MNNIVTTSELTKHYGRIHAVENLNLSIPEKSVFGILGPNGSGKTTTLGMMLNVINPSSGSYVWFNNNPNSNYLKNIGSILESPAFYPYLSAIDNLKIIANIKSSGYENINEVLKITGIYERRFYSFSTFSLGMKQRLALAAALLTDPLVLILDEPTNGLDPKGIAEIREIIIKIAQQGKTIILASHLLDEVQKVCSHFAVLDKGKLIYSGSINEAQSNKIIEIASDDLEKLSGILKRFPDIINIEINGEILFVTIPVNISIGNVSRFAFENGASITHLVSQKKSLETQFLEILKKN